MKHPTISGVAVSLVALIALATMANTAPLVSLHYLSMLDMLLSKVKVPQEVQDWTEYVIKEYPQFGQMNLDLMFYVVISRPPSDAFTSDENKCDQFLTDVLEALEFSVDPETDTRRFGKSFPRHSAESRPEVSERTKGIRDNLTACLISWGARNGLVKFQRVHNPNAPLTGFRPGMS